MRTLADTRIRWVATFATSSNLSDLRAAVRGESQDNPCNNGLRSVCWKAFLLFENLDRSTWIKTLLDSREAYTALKKHFLRDIENPDDLSAADPLAVDETSPWNVLRRDEILRDEIYQDVERCMPDNLYFREPSTRSILLEVLFIFCKLNADTGYRQGMHEILAPILWVISRDVVDPTTVEDHQKELLDDEILLRATLDPSYAEHDAFTVFCIIMQTAKSFYEMGSNTSQTVSADLNNSPIVERSKRIHEDYLRRVDPELTKHLTAIEVLPQIFVIRWIRLLFGREFPFEDVLCLWDILFAEDPALDLVDFICVAMLLRIRWQLMDADYSSALTLLLRYPVPSEPNGPPTFVDDALYLRQHLTLEGGAYIIAKYSIRLPGAFPTDTSIPRRGVETEVGLSTPSSIGTRPRSPMLSPSRFLQEQWGIEGILQEAARGMQFRGDKWGVGRVLRGAVQSLQSGNSSPRKPLAGVRWSLDEGRAVAVADENLVRRIKALEERNKALSKILENAMAELSIQQRQLETEKSDILSDALSLAIAKIQFVQVYLEDSSMPLLFPETQSMQESVATTKASTPATDAGMANGPISKTTSTSRTGQLVINNVEPTDPMAIRGSTTPSATEIPPLATSDSESAHLSATSTPASAVSRLPKSKPLASPFQHSRPSLAQSSFSWLMGDDQRKSSFVSASPLSPESKRENVARGKAGYLFGDDKAKGTNSGSGSGKVKVRGREEMDEASGFTLGTLKGGLDG